MNRVNPYWIINEMSNTSKKNRLISSASISYKITDKLKFKLSGGADITEFSFEDFAPISTPSHESGYLKTQTNSNRTINADAVLTYSTNLGKKHESGRNGRIEPLPCGQLPDHDHGQGHGRTRNQENQQFLRQDDRRIALPETNQLGLRHGQSGV